MTIGIAAFGPNAGLAVIKALAAAECIGRGAIGGFVSYVVIAADRAVHRAETQRGGTEALFAGGPPALLAEARVAGLMSSGPNRPVPLAQFTPADPAVGLITGHRMPNTIGANGKNLNDEVLDLMRAGLDPTTAVDRVITQNPTIDAGIIALALDGRMHSADTDYIAQFADAGRATLGSARDGAVVTVVHNAIRPFRSLALLAAEIALDVMMPADVADAHVTLCAGTMVNVGPRSALRVDDTGLVVGMTVADRKYSNGSWSLGLGYHVPVIQDTRRIGYAIYEPYLVVEDGRITSIDGAKKGSLPVRRVEC